MKTFRTILYLRSKIRQYDPGMLTMMLFYSLLSFAYPFIWVWLPARLIHFREQGLTLSESRALPLILSCALLALVSSFFTAFLTGNYRMRMNNVRYRLIRDLLAYSLNMPYENTLYSERLDAIQRANYSVLSPVEGAGGVILKLLTVFGEILAALGFAGILSFLSLPLFLSVTLISVLTFRLSSRQAEREAESYGEIYGTHLRKADLAFEAAEQPSLKKDLLSYRLFGLIEHYAQQYAHQAYLVLRDLAAFRCRQETLIAGLSFLRDSGVYLWLAREFLLSRISISEFYFYTAGLIAFITYLQTAMQDIAQIAKNARLFRAYVDCMQDAASSNQSFAKTNPNFSQNSPGCSNSKTKVSQTAGLSLEVKDLHFSYPGQDKAVLKGLSLKLQAGERVALVGENGCGKSTLIKLLCRLYNAPEGQILIDGCDLCTFSEQAYRQQLSVIFQDAMILPFSVRENISMSSEVDPERLEAAVKSSHLDQLTDRYPKGLDTTLLRVLDDEGVDCSGGQKQNLYMARALYKESARFLIFDEPTAALDPLSERRFYEDFERWVGPRTCLFISHRLASTQFCDRVLFMQDGRICEEGSHAELMALNGRYAELFRLQAKNYQEAPSDETIC